MSLDNLPVEWCSSNLLDICHVKTGKVDANHAEENGLYNFFTCALEPLKANTYSFDGDLIILPGNGANVGHVEYVKGKIEAYQRTYVLHDFEQVDSKYIFYHLKYLWKKINLDKQYGSATNYIKIGNFQNYNVEIAALAEQQEIVRQLDVMLAQVEQIKARLDAIPAILKKFRQSVLADVVSGELINQDFNQLPVESFSDYLTDVRYGTSKKCSESLIDAVPVLRIPNIADDGTLDFTNLKYAEFESKEIKQLQLSKGDLLLIRSNGSLDLVGKSAIADELDKVVLYAGYLIRLRFSDSVNPQFIQYFLQAPQTRQTIENIARSTSGVNNINSKEIASLKIKLPCIDHQNEVVLRVKQLLELSKRIEETIQSAQKRVNLLTQSILAKAFSGELTIEWREQHQELITGVNSAEALLAKIQAEREASKPVKKVKKVK